MFVTQSTSECDTQKYEDVFERFEHRKQVEAQYSRPDTIKAIPQEIKVECDGNTDLKSESESSQCPRSPNRERKPPQ